MDRDTQGEVCVMTKAEIGVKQLQAEECQAAITTTRNYSYEEARKDSTQSLRRSLSLLTP